METGNVSTGSWVYYSINITTPTPELVITMRETESTGFLWLFTSLEELPTFTVLHFLFFLFFLFFCDICSKSKKRYIAMQIKRQDIPFMRLLLILMNIQ